jgi:hypothetical protein
MPMLAAVRALHRRDSRVLLEALFLHERQTVGATPRDQR